MSDAAFIYTMWSQRWLQLVKLLGVTFKHNLKMYSYISNIMKTCSQRLYLLKQLWHQGLSSQHLDTVFQSIIVMRVAYAISAWCSFTNKEKQGQIDAFLKRAYHFGLLGTISLLHRSLTELTALSLLIQTIVFISFYLPPGHSIFTFRVLQVDPGAKFFWANRQPVVMFWLIYS